MRAPKMLPWIARRSGITEARAAALWDEALRIADERGGPSGSPEYWATAMERWLALVDAGRERPAGGGGTPNRGRWPYSLILKRKNGVEPRSAASGCCRTLRGRAGKRAGRAPAGGRYLCL